MARVIWTPEAVRTLDGIGAYLSKVAPDYSGRLLTAIRAAMDPVATFPRLGRMVPEFGAESLREIILENYRIVYSILEDTIYVLSVLHAAMDVAARLRELGLSDT